MQSPSNTTLPFWKWLKENSGAPTEPERFNRIAVGSLLQRRKEFYQLIDNMVNRSEPSQKRYILGKNGNGKSLLVNMIIEYAASQNIALDAKTKQPVLDKEARPLRTFDVLFAKTSWSPSHYDETGLELAASLQRTPQEPTEYLYAAMATNALTRFAQWYEKEDSKNPLFQLVRSFSQNRLKKYLGEISEYLQIILKDSSLRRTLDNTYIKLQESFTSERRQKALRRYAAQQSISEFLIRQYTNAGLPMTIADVKESLKRDFKRTGLSRLVDAVEAIHSMAKAFNTSLIMLVVEDFNDIPPTSALVPLLDKVESYKEPSVLFIFNGLEAVWEDYKNNKAGHDKGLIDRLEGSSGRTIRKVEGPTHSDVRQLIDKLVALMNEELDGRVELSEDDKMTLANGWPLDGTFRHAIEYVINALEKKIIK